MVRFIVFFIALFSLGITHAQDDSSIYHLADELEFQSFERYRDSIELKLNADWYFEHKSQISQPNLSLGTKKFGIGFGKFHKVYSGINFNLRSVHTEAIFEHEPYIDYRKGFHKSRYFRTNNGILLSGYSYGTSVNGLSIGGLLQGDYLNGIAISVISNNHKNVNGVAVSLFKNQAEIMNGVDISLFKNKSEKMNGLAMSFVNEFDNFRGISITGIGIYGGAITGISLSGIFNKASDLNGLLISSVYNEASIVNGMSLTIGMNEIDELNGFALGAINHYDRMKGLSIGLILSGTKYSDCEGVSISGIFNKSEDVNGMLISGFYNKADRIKGVSLTCGINRFDQMNGVALGAINKFEDISGLSIGLINSDYG
ncbi:MAG: hypothetical protein HYZ42_17115, partial [Bacteroidetes bacterium]|nr:hypothetical protein [Bacteroidota bacterium]